MVRVTRLTLHCADGLQNTLVAPENILGGSRSPEVALRHGHHETTVRLVESGAGDGMTIGTDVWKNLHLPEEDCLDVHVLWDEQERLIRIGPLVAVMAQVRRRKGQPVGPQVPVFQRLTDAGRMLGVLTYIFSPLEIQWAKGMVKGSYWNTARQWTTAYFPLPDVVYDQVVSRRFEGHSDVKKSRDKLIHLLYPRYFNAGFFDKWTVFQWLSMDERTCRHLPATIPYRTPEQGAQFLRERGDIYVKPARGSLGRGLARLQMTDNGRAQYRWRKGHGRTETGIYKDPRTWFEQHHRFLRHRHYVLQETIPIWPVGGGVWDVRVLMQKDGSQRWRRTKMFVRVSNPGDIASNLAAGGRAGRMEALLEHLPLTPAARKTIARRVSRTARHVARVVEDRSGLVLGEMGVDLGVDERGGIWIIEVNSKPWKSPDTEEGSEQLLEKSFLRPVAYAKSLAGFSP
ncbi:MAG: YheC/YheD family protein [Kyrpidia sp.]|nr:YheC/YheD family protein [Kyrpidia sp.]